MIEQGDGRFADLLRLDLCPKCEAALVKQSDNGLRIDRECPVCNLKIIEYRDKDRGNG
jgi:Zn-finger nucleic acid-binding protein